MVWKAVDSLIGAVTEYAADSCALECKEQQDAAQQKLTESDADGLAKLKVCSVEQWQALDHIHSHC